MLDLGFPVIKKGDDEAGIINIFDILIDRVTHLGKLHLQRFGNGL